MNSPTVVTLLRDEVEAALSTVRDPELDEPITDLGFVRDLWIEGSTVVARLRLPTSFCSPSFAYLMASDALDAIRAVPGVARAEVLLDDHSDSPRINAGIAAGLGFAGTFLNETESELDELRRIFQVKAHLAAIERVCTVLMLQHARQLEDLPAITLDQLPDDAATAALLHRRADLGLTLEPTSPLLIDENGAPWQTMSLALQLRFAKLTRVSIDGNAHFCRGLLRTRYPDAEAGQRPRSHEIYTIQTRKSAS